MTDCIIPKRSVRKIFNFCYHPEICTKIGYNQWSRAGLRKVRDEAAVQIARSKVSEILKSAKPPQRNITHEEEEALKELKKDESIVILKADKGTPQSL